MIGKTRLSHLIRKSYDLAGWNADDGCAVIDPMGDNGSCADDCIRAYVEPLKNRRVQAHEYTWARGDTSAKARTGTDIAIVTYRTIVIYARGVVDDDSAPQRRARAYDGPRKDA